MSVAPARFAWLSLAAAVITLALKLAAWKLTDSVGLLSDALETLINVSGALMALSMLRLASQPPDEEHAYGHNKAEYFSSGFEGLLIFIAAGLIFYEAAPRLLDPQPLEVPGLGLLIAAIATVINLVVSRVLANAGRRYKSITLVADGKHLMTDVWTTIGVILGVGLVVVTNQLWLDPVVAMLVAVHVLWTGIHLLREAASGLMDAAWPEEDQAVLFEVLADYRRRYRVDFHAVRTRCAASRRFVSMHVLVPGDWTVKRGHDIVEELEHHLSTRIPFLTVFSHMEPLEDPASYGDEGLDR